jgi:hypothetical protein
MLSALLTFGTGFSMIHFAVGFIVLICVLAIVVLGLRFLCSVLGVTIPAPLLTILAIIVFLVLFLALVDYSGLYTF